MPETNLHTDIKQIVLDYLEARAKRRELFGPDLFDTVSDIGKVTLRPAQKHFKNLQNEFYQRSSKDQDNDTTLETQTDTHLETQTNAAQTTTEMSDAKRRDRKRAQTEAFVDFYLDHREDVRKTFDILDAQVEPKPTLKDYMIASGFQTMWSELSPKQSSDVSVNSQPSSSDSDLLVDIREVADIIDHVMSTRSLSSQVILTQEDLDNLELEYQNAPQH